MRTYLRRMNGKIYKFAIVTYRYSKKQQKRIDFTLDKSLGWKLIEGYGVGVGLQEIYAREFNDFSRDK